VTVARAGRTFEVRYAVTFSEDALTFGRLRGFDTVHLADGDSTHLPGRPSVPGRTVRVALPAGMQVTGARVARLQTVELPGEYTLLPAQAPRPLADRAQPNGFVPPDRSVYASREPYPGKWVELLHQTDLAGQSMAVLRIHPLQYTPAERRLTLAAAMEIVIEGMDGYVCGDYLPAAASARTRASYKRMLAASVVNPEDVALAEPSASPTISRGVAPGQYEYVIITQDAWVNEWQPLADWRTQKGSPATIVTTEWIYSDGGYAGSDLEKVRGFVQDAHANWGATYFLLGGDTNVIPYHVRTITVPTYGAFELPNDTYYADYDDDWSCEVHVGRYSARTAAAISNFVTKIFAYERNPPMTNYVTTAAFFGFDISTPGDQHGEISKEFIRGLHLPSSWTIDTEYDSEPGAHKADVLAYLNQGHHLVNHHDHCNQNSMGAGWISHGDLMYTSDINSLTNGDRQSIAFAVGCYPAHTPTVTSIGEAFVLNPTGGGVAFMGNSSYGWGGSTEDPDWYTVRQDRYFYRALFDEGYERLGECFTRLKNDAFDPYDPYNLNKFCFTQLHLLGDPELVIWTEDPQALSVVHGDRLGTGGMNNLPVHVASGGSPVQGATICLWKGDEVYEVGQTGASGTVIFQFAAATAGTLRVTVTAHNYLPYEGGAQVSDSFCPGDINGDGFRNVTDFTQFAPAFGSRIGQANYKPGADLNGDGFVNVTDFTQLAAVYGQACP
jgi:hypothetical protein